MHRSPLMSRGPQGVQVAGGSDLVVVVLLFSSVATQFSLLLPRSRGNTHDLSLGNFQKLNSEILLGAVGK